MNLRLDKSVDESAWAANENGLGTIEEVMDAKRIKDTKIKGMKVDVNAFSDGENDMKKNCSAVVAVALTAAFVMAAGCGVRSETVQESVGSTSQMPSYFIELAIFNDNANFRYNEAGTETRSGALFIMTAEYFKNSYGKMNAAITPILVEQVTFTEKDPFEVPLDSNNQVDPNKLLENFKNYVGSLPAEKRNFDAAILMSGQTFRQPALQASFTGGVCQDGFNLGVVQVNHYNNDPFDAVILSRSLGHILGLCNDPPASRAVMSCAVLKTPDPIVECANSIMEATIDPSNPPSSFSACSGEDFARNLSIGQATCLTNQPGTGK